MSDHLPLDFSSDPASIPPAADAAAARAHAPRHTAPAPDEDGHLLDYVKVLYRRRYVAATAFVLVVLGVVIHTFTATPIYQARVQLLIESDNPNVVSFKEVIEQEKATNDYYQTQYRMLQSRSLARRTLDNQQLWSVFDGSTAPKTFSVRGAIAGSIGWVAGLVRPAPEGEVPGADETAEQSRALDAFLANLTVSPIRNSRLVDVKYEMPNAELAAQIVNALARMYIEQSLEFKYTSSKEASDWLGERLAEQRKQVEITEAAMQRYREQNDALSLEERQNIVVQKLADLNSAVTRAKTERIQRETLHQQLVAIQADRTALDTVPAILQNQFVQQQKSELAGLQRQQAQLSDKLGPNHPEMIRVQLAIDTAQARIDGEIAKIIQSVKNDALAAQAQEASLVRALEQQKIDALELNRKGIEYGVLQRDAASNRQIFEALMQRTKETGISGELRTSNIRVVDAAEVPRGPARPNKPANLLLALVGGLMLAAAAAFSFEYLDNRITSPAEIKTHLGLPFLGMIPAITVADGSTPLLTNGVTPGFAEAFRGVRTNVLFSSAGDGVKSLVVTSTGPGEGKTLVACNLALALAQTGQRVILIDGDMRRPRVHEAFGIPQEPGLSNVLVGDAKASDTVRQAAEGTLWILPAGRTPPNPAELLGSTRFADFIETLGTHFTWVVIDSPPVMAVTDAPLVSHIAGATVFVVGAEMTGANVARTAVEQLAAANGRLIGAVLNRVDLEHNGYYYSQYYRREYGTYYVKTA
jgi:capsular exopolysaccharide synthesis family protein